MVYKRYIKRNGKLVGPYYYKTVKEKNGKTRTIYIGRTVPAATREEKTTPFYGSNVSQLKKNIQLCDAKKELLRINLNKLVLRYQNKELSYGQYELLKNKYLKGKTPEHWYNYYDSYKGEVQGHIRKYLFASSCLEYIKTVSDTGKELEKVGEEKQRIPHVFQEKISQLQNNALVCEQRKIQLKKRLQEYKQRYDGNLIKYSQYELLKNSYLKGKTPEYWFSYYDNQKLGLQEQINKYKLSSTCEIYTKEIFEVKPSLKDKVLTEIVEEDLELEEPKFYDKNKSLMQIVSFLIISLILIPSLLLTAPMINSFFSKEQPLDLTNLEFSVVKKVSVVKGAIDRTVVSNLPKKQEREQQELKKSYEKEVEKPEEKTVEEQQTAEQEFNIVSDIINPITEFLGISTPTSFAISEENITTPYAILPEENVIMPSENITIPEENITIPEENITIPEENITIPEENITLPEENITLPEGNITIPEENITLPEENTTLPEENVTEVITYTNLEDVDYFTAWPIPVKPDEKSTPGYVEKPEYFCTRTNSIEMQRADLGGELTFNISELSKENISEAKICAYAFASLNTEVNTTNYIQEISEQERKKTPTIETINSGLGLATITPEEGWKCITITDIAKNAIKQGKKKIYFKWVGEDATKTGIEQMTCFKSNARDFDTCGYNPTGANNCDPYLSVTYEK
jgi:hypothetical protein